jgi:hypothetical protein
MIYGIVLRMRRIPAAVVTIWMLLCAPATAATNDVAAWSISLLPTDFVIGAALAHLGTRRTWATGLDERSGAFEIALRKKAVAIRAPGCHMDFLILTIPFYYPENPKQASASERRAVYDAFVAFQAGGSGRLTVQVEAPASLARIGANGIELAGCNLYFAFPPSVQVSGQTPGSKR